MRKFIILIVVLVMTSAITYYVYNQDYMGSGSEIPIVAERVIQKNKMNNNENNSKNHSHNHTHNQVQIVDPTFIDPPENDFLSKIIIEMAEDFDDLTYTFNDTKSLELYNANTKEKIDITFWRNGNYVPVALDRLNQFMRDWRQDQTIDIDPELYTLLHDLYQEVDGQEPITLLSGFRSEETNKKLREMGRKPAKKSQHLLGKAADIYIPGVPVRELREEALELERGGVGYYPNNSFIHVDTGRVRQW